MLAQSASANPQRIDRVNRAFVDHLEQLTTVEPGAVELVRESWHAGLERPAESFVPEALGVLYPAFGSALEAFEAERPQRVVELLDQLPAADDPFLVSNAAYYHARSLISAGLYEEAERYLDGVTQAHRLEDYTPFAPHIWFLRGFSQAMNLRFDEARTSLETLLQTYADAPEMIRVAARQLLIETDRRAPGTLDEVSSLMGYAAHRIHVTDRGDSVRARQADAIALLDKLIEEAEQEEQSGGGGGAGSQSRGGAREPQPARAPAEQSVDPGGGEAQIGELHGAGRADPGEMWGKLPPAERERILQSLRTRFPSRYRQLVEQYYRSLAEGK
jgi:tetratricopeptide (TPR) repeat protein